MPKLSKKRKTEISMTSFAVDIIKKYDSVSNVSPHWTDWTPENWSKEEKELWDMVFELEDSLKNRIIEIVESRKL